MRKIICGGSYHSLARLQDGRVMAWGRNNVGQLGDGTTVDRLLPGLVSGITVPRDIAAGNSTSYALGNDGYVRVWGRCYAVVGPIVDLIAQTLPTRIARLRNPKTIEAQGTDALAVYKDLAFAWDSHVLAGPAPAPGMFGFLNPHLLPHLVDGPDRVIDVAGGIWSNFVLRNARPWVLSWGRNIYGQLGDGTYTDRDTPAAVRGLPRIVAIAAGSSHALALDDRGRVFGWGWNRHAQLGTGTTAESSPSAIQIEGLPENIKAIDAGAAHNLALDADHRVWAWGMNGAGQVGDGTGSNRRKPVVVLDGIKTIAACSQHSFAVDSQDRLWGWGYNEYGQLGDGTNVTRTRPKRINALPPVG